MKSPSPAPTAIKVTASVQRRIRCFEADILAENQPMLGAFRSAR